MPPVTTAVIPIIEGEIKDAKCIGEGYPLNNLDALTDGTLAAGNPDHFYGVRPEQLNRQIRNELKLGHYIQPSIHRTTSRCCQTSF